MLCYNKPMKHIVEEYHGEIYQSAIWDFYFKDLNIGVLDIETTGLDPSRNKFILGGLYNCQTGRLHQILAESRSEEPEALAEYMEEIRDLDVVVTYNGRHFDMPFLARRLEVLRAGGKYPGQSLYDHGRRILSKTYDLDLFLVVQGHSPIKKLVPNLRQKTIENYMGFWDTRADEISGAESVELYNHYEKTQDPLAEQKILLHNNDDIRQLTRLTKVISKCDMHRAMYALGFPAGNLFVQKPLLRKNELIIQGRQTGRPEEWTDYMGFELDGFPIKTRFSAKDGTFRFEVPILRNAGLTVVDLEAAGLCADSMERYPSCGSGFLVLADTDSMKYMEINHFTKALLQKFQEEVL